MCFTQDILVDWLQVLAKICVAGSRKFSKHSQASALLSTSFAHSYIFFIHILTGIIDGVITRLHYNVMISHVNILDIFRRKKIFQNTPKHRISSTIDVDKYVVIDVEIMYIIPFFNMTLSLKDVL